VDWGDGTVTPVDPENRQLSSIHRYASAGTYTISVEVCDDDGGCAIFTESVEVKAVGSDVPEVEDPTPVAPDTPTPVAPVAPGIPVPPVGADPVGPTTAPGPIMTDLPETGSDVGSWLSAAIVLILLGWLGRQLAQRPRQRA
jgi:hypothetical protein